MKKYLASILILLTTLSPNAFAKVPPNFKGANQAFASMLKTAMPAVVNITVQGQLPPIPFPFAPPEQEENHHSKFGPNVSPKFEDVGSGVIIDAKHGYIVTNAHVLVDAKMIIVTLSDGRRLRAKMIGLDKASDIAVVQIKANHLTGIPLGNSNQVDVGDFVAAIGNPFGLHQTVTSGVVSALHRNLGIEGPKGYEDFIQTDAPINPGNSGGALVNMRGELIGINTAIIAPLGGNIGIGFAIPISMARNVVEQLIKYGKVHRGMLGVMVQDFTPNLADAFNMPNVTGVLITQVNPNTPASKAKLKSQDIIEAVNGEPLTNAGQLRSIVGLVPTNTKLHFKVRRGNRTFTTTAKIEAASKEQEIAKGRLHFLSGITLRNYDMFNSAVGEIKGVQVLEVEDTSDAWLGGLRPGDVIVTANGEVVDSIDKLLAIAQNNSKQLLVKIWHGGGMVYLVIT